MKDIAKILLGNLLMAFAYAFITVPNGIINGGVTGSALIIARLTNIDVAYFSNAITILLLLSSLIFIGKAFFVKTILSSVLYMGLFTAFHATGVGLMMHPLFAAVLGGVVVGFAYFCCIDANSSTAGYDVIAIAVNRKFPKRNVAVTLRYISIGILAIGCFSNGIWAVLYGVLFTLIQTAVLKLLMAYSARMTQKKAGTILPEGE